MKWKLLVALCFMLTACKSGDISVLEMGDKTISSDSTKK